MNTKLHLTGSTALNRPYIVEISDWSSFQSIVNAKIAKTSNRNSENSIAAATIVSFSVGCTYVYDGDNIRIDDESDFNTPLNLLRDANMPKFTVSLHHSGSDDINRSSSSKPSSPSISHFISSKNAKDDVDRSVLAEDSTFYKDSERGGGKEWPPRLRPFRCISSRYILQYDGK
jgi:hypothetical protein